MIEDETTRIAALIDRQAAEIADLKVSVAVFCAPVAVNRASSLGLPKNHIEAHYYDILENAGARMDDFVRYDPTKGQQQ
jgi:hypothetical protein